MTGAGPAPPSRPTHDGRRRVTCDLDDATPFDLYHCWFNLEAAGAERIEARVSSSGEGCHVRAWFREIDETAVEQLRLAFGDHVYRTILDRTHRLKPPQMLFTRKPDGSEASAWCGDVAAVADELRTRSDRYGVERWQSA